MRTIVLEEEEEVYFKSVVKALGMTIDPIYLSIYSVRWVCVAEGEDEKGDETVRLDRYSYTVGYFSLLPISHDALG